MWFLCLSYCLMLPCWTGMSRANSVTLAREGSSAETCHRKEPPDKGPTPSSQSGSSGAGWGSSAHPHDSLAPSNGPCTLWGPSHYWNGGISHDLSVPPSWCWAWFLVAQAASDGRTAPFHVSELIWVTPPSYWCQGRSRHILRGGKPHKSLS